MLGGTANLKSPTLRILPRSRGGGCQDDAARRHGADNLATSGRGGSYFVYALALFAAADALAITLLSEWIATAISYIPAFVAGVLVIIIEFILTDFVADVAAGTDAMDDYTSNSRASCSGGTPPRAAWPSATNAGGVKSRRSHSPVENSSTSRPRRATRSATRNFSVLPRAFQSR